MSFNLKRFKVLVVAGVMSVTLGREAKAVFLEEETLNKDKMLLRGEETLNKDKSLLMGDKKLEKEIALVVKDFYGNDDLINNEKEIQQIIELAKKFYLNVYTAFSENLSNEEAIKQAVNGAFSFYAFEQRLDSGYDEEMRDDLTTTGDTDLYLAYVAHNSEDELKLIRK